ncbi:ribonuclease H2, subunit B [Dactylonectria estremocensis]|uniref:Ribonuclease H2 subunit B n=1 Tax=Dactylonectria estremocensis TaxID=1079267 RepID=A0A9P9F477_9HYPO|nr:ribonuclease H2, subunit B [Dactylonectria estremocensis]
MARTRSAKPTPASKKDSSDSKPASSRFPLPPPSESASKLFILPSKATSEARIVTLPNPRHARPSRYLVCPETGIYEFTKVAAPKTTPRSWLIEPTSTTTEEGAEKAGKQSEAETSTGQELYMATAIDPLFLCLPALAKKKASKGSDEQKRMFLTSDDHFEKLPEESSHLSEILRWPNIRSLIETRMGAICDTVEAGDETVFRLNEKKLVDVILNKAKRMSNGGLPLSMDEKFVKKALEAPILAQKREMKGGELVTGDPKLNSQGSTPRTESTESQSTVASNDTVASSGSQPLTAATSFSEDEITADDIVSAMEASLEVIQLQRLRVAFNFICSNYVAPTLAVQLEKSLSTADASLTNFAPLDEYLLKLSKLRADAVASRSAGDYSRKHDRDEEEDEARAEKKRKLEEEKKKKATESRGIRELKKVNTKGMKKMSDFFKKK